MLSKSNLRQILKTERLRLSNDQLASISRIICDKAYQSIDWQNVTTVHHYMAISRSNEVDCESLLDKIRRNHPHILTMTWLDNKNFSIRASGLDNSSELRDSMLFDVIIVPMLGFNNDRHRLGYGGGFYDQFLATQPQAKKIGLCFSAGNTEKLPVEEHDIALDMIITEDQIL